jgi:folate-binding protein YgfZ
MAARARSAHISWSCEARRSFSVNNSRFAQSPGHGSIHSTSGLAKLEHRGLISVVGEDATKLLQGIVTNSMQAFGNKPGVYAGFLNAQGRILTDCFIYRIQSPQKDGADAYLLEVDRSVTTNLLRYLNTHKLRSKVSLKPLPEDEFVVWTAWDEKIGQLATEAKWPASSVLQMADPRLDNFAHRMLIPGQMQSPEKIKTVLPETFLSLPPASHEAYRLQRYLSGLAEGIPDILPNKSLPHEYNMDHLNGIDFQKGCYVGQELTIRTQHTGVVRKRILPVQIYDAGCESPKHLHAQNSADANLGESGAADIPRDTKIRPLGRQRTSAGKWTAGLQNVGLAVCRLEMMTDIRVSSDEGEPFEENKEFELAVWQDGEGNDQGSVKVKAFVPDWLRSKLQKT